VRPDGSAATETRRANRDPIIVLKFGGSVLGTQQDAVRAGHEVFRWIREGYRVVAVVSALEGHTDQLLARARAWSEGTAAGAAASATAALVATGEQQSAAILALALDRAGIPAEVLDHAAIGLLTDGPALDAAPVALDANAVCLALSRVRAIVIPGFTGRDGHGRVTLLGRGGSDLSALFLAQRLGARCRLIKDVEGLYDRDPAIPGPPARRYATLAWDDALALDGTIVQHKGVRFAREHALQFEVAALLATDASVVGPGPLRLDEIAAPATPSLEAALRPIAVHEPRVPRVPLRVTILGAGVVGGGVYDALTALPTWFEVACVAARDLDRAASRGIPRHLLTTDLDAALNLDAEILVELIGGLDPAQSVVARALREGRAVVTANKAIVADPRFDLPRLAADSGAILAFSAAVGGAVPALETAGRLRGTTGVTRVEGVLNGTTNFVLGRVGAGESFADAVRAAQAAGFAEADPARDLDGRDAADKLALVVRAAFGITLDPATIQRTALDDAGCRQSPPSAGLVLKHIARAELGSDGAVRASVTPRWVDRSSPIGATVREENAVVFTAPDGQATTIQGKGAGRWPTTQAVVSDLLDIARSRLASPASESPPTSSTTRHAQRRAPAPAKEPAHAR